MVSKIVTTAGKFILKNTGKSIGKKISDTYDYLNDRIGFGSRPLNVGENETLECLKRFPNDFDRCKAIGNDIRNNYHHPLQSDTNKLKERKK